MTWLLLALIAVGLTAAYGIIDKALFNRPDDLHPIAFAATMFGTVTILVLITNLIIGFQPTDIHNLMQPQNLLLLGIDVLLYTLAPSLYFRAFKNLPISETTILYSLTGIFSLLIGSVLGTEIFTIGKLLGGICILTAIILISRKKEKFNFGKYFFFMIAATFIYGNVIILDDYLISQQIFSPLFFQLWNFGIPAILILLFNRGSFKHLPQILNKKIYPIVFISSLFLFLSYVAFFNAYAMGADASQVGMIMGTETILIVIFATLFLKERDRFWMKLFAALLSVVGVWLLK